MCVLKYTYTNLLWTHNLSWYCSQGCELTKKIHILRNCKLTLISLPKITMHQIAGDVERPFKTPFMNFEEGVDNLKKNTNFIYSKLLLTVLLEYRPNNCLARMNFYLLQVLPKIKFIMSKNFSYFQNSIEFPSTRNIKEVFDWPSFRENFVLDYLNNSEFWLDKTKLNLYSLNRVLNASLFFAIANKRT